jgi:hypothetical protein
MSADPFHLNRPVHLARRDGFYEKATALIARLDALKTPEDQRQTAEKALSFFREARRHAAAANLAEKTSLQSRLFAEFLDMAIDNTLSITRMLRRPRVAETPDSPVRQLLQSGDTSEKMRGHYRRCAAHILKGLTALLKAAEKPCHDLQQTSLAKMSSADKARYEKARKYFEKETEDEAEKTGDSSV